MSFDAAHAARNVQTHIIKYLHIDSFLSCVLSLIASLEYTSTAKPHSGILTKPQRAT